MTASTKAIIKTYFQTSDKPTEAQFVDLIDSYQDANTVLSTLTSSATGIQVKSSATGVVSRSVVVSAAALITVENGDGIAGNINLSLPATVDLTGRRTLVATASAASSDTTAASTAFVAARATGALVLLLTTSATNAASVTFNSTYITNAYNKYIVEFDGVFCPTGTSLYLTESTNNGSVYLSSNYHWGGGSVTVAGPTQNAYGNAADSKLNLDLAIGGGGTLGTAFSGTIKFGNPFLTGSICQFQWNLQGGSTTTINVNGTGYNTTTTNINNIKFAADSGNITGNFHLYGISGT